MTNETIVATNAVGKISAVLGERLRCGGENIDGAISALSEKGAQFAVDAAVAAAVFAVGWLVIRAINAVVSKALAKRGATLMNRFVCSVVSKSCWAVLIVTVLGQLGVDVAPLVAGLGVTGFILGFAFQESLGNLASGLMIALNTPFKIGDFVQAAGLEGTILELNMMATVMTTPDNKKIVVPNKSIWGGPIINFSAMETRRVDFKVGVSYGCDIAKAKALALEALRSVEGAIEEPAPSAEPASFDDSQVTFNMRVWTKNADYWPVYSAAMQKVKSAFDAGGIEIPFPQIDIHTPGAKA
ncbi:MAG: mechanosensitive ion channel family protein [Kiritimatiellae bacterium]|nr:mechanosensitive ion channel family protein [Kiritimatiellia bacterium]